MSDRQWTPEQIAEAAAFIGPPRPINRLPPMVKFLVGREATERSNPKAYERRAKD